MQQAVEAIALCHNVTPLYDEVVPTGYGSSDQPQQISYQAASPDEVALVTWSESVGIALVQRDMSSMQLRVPTSEVTRRFTILQLFPFTSETKRMGIIVKVISDSYFDLMCVTLQDETTDEITFYMKGADSVMSTIVRYNDWLEEECANMAREGLRTLAVAKKPLTHEQYAEFEVITIVSSLNVFILETISSSKD